jgi:predicted HTH domain antitoxin
LARRDKGIRLMSRTITMEVSDELVKLLGSEEKMGKEANQALVMDLVRRGKISKSKAAELLGIRLWDLPELLSSYEMPWFTYSKEQMKTDMAALRRYEMKTKA